MLVITRKLGESLLIGDDIEIKLEDIQKGQVRLSISAPREVKILRKEILQAITEENMAANVKDSNAAALNDIAEKLKLR